MEKFDKYIAAVGLLPPERGKDGKPVNTEKINVLILVDDTDSQKMSKAELREKLQGIIITIAAEIDKNLVSYLKDRIYRDIKSALFLHYYEKLHIENAKDGIERAIIRENYDLIYRIDPPQMPHDGWKDVLNKISGGKNVNLEFSKSENSQGIQFADLIAGAFRSFIVRDKNEKAAHIFLKAIKSKMIFQEGNPNPNLIMYNEINNRIKERIKDFWRI